MLSDTFLKNIDWTGAVKFTLTLAASSDRVQITTGGIYYITADVDCFVEVGTVAVVATTSDTPLWAKTYGVIEVQEDEYIAAIGSAGLLYVIQNGRGGA